MPRAKSFGTTLVCWLLLVASATVEAHTLQAPAIVEVESDGSFRFEVILDIGPGDESLSFYETAGSDNLDMPGLVADGFCISVLEEGQELTIGFNGSLIDPARGGTAFLHLETCGLSGSQTVFAAAIEIVPARRHALYWVESGAVRRTSFDGGAVETVIDAGDADATGFISLDTVGGRIYWTATEDFVAAIRRADLYGGGIEGFSGGGKGGPGGIVVDVPQRQLYRADPSDCIPMCGSIGRRLLDGSAGEILITLNIPEALDVSSDLDLMCWGDEWDDWVQCSRIDGGDPRTISADSAPDGVALDPVTGKVYWTERSNSRIRRADTDGSNVEDVVTLGLDQPRDLALDPIGRKLYWTDRGSDKIQRAGLDGSDVEDLLTDLDNPAGIALLSGRDSIELELAGNLVVWSQIPGALKFDVVRGDLGILRAEGGNFEAAALDCLADSVSGTFAPSGPNPDPGEGIWFLVRAVTVTGNGTYGPGGLSQVAARDPGITASGVDCP